MRPPPPPSESYFRVWQQIDHTEAEHSVFHSSLWAAKTEAGYIKTIVAAVGKSIASEADRQAVIAHIETDPPTARVLASMASSFTCFAEGEFSKRLTVLREAAGLSVSELADKCDMNRQAIYKLESGESNPTWETVQKLALALGVGTDAFRTSRD